MKIAKLSLVLLTCVQPVKGRPTRTGGIRGKQQSMDPNLLGMIQAKPDIGVDFDRLRPQRSPTRANPPDSECRKHPSFDDPAWVEYNLCGDLYDEDPPFGLYEVPTRLKWAVRYLRAAVNSKPFSDCLQHAVDYKHVLKTSHEHVSVGPYMPCAGSIKDADFIMKNGWGWGKRGYELAMNTTRQAGRDSNRKVILDCKKDLTFPMESPDTTSNRWDYDKLSDWSDDKTHLIQVDVTKVFFANAPHPNGYDEYYEGFGTCGGEGCYPVDELSGMMVHEMLHNLKIDHGSEANECDYTQYNCPKTWPIGVNGSCRANSLNEIAEACVTEVVEESIRECHPETCCHRWELPIWESASDSGNPKDIGDHNPNSPGGVCTCTDFW